MSLTENSVDSASAAFARDGVTARIRVATDSMEVRASFVVIATGRVGGFGGRRQRRGPPTLAITGVWQKHVGIGL